MRTITSLLSLLLLALPVKAQTPDEVMQNLMAALKGNDANNAGIEFVFEYASPANKAMTGPLDRFIRMVSRHPYGELVNHQSAEIGEPRIDGRAMTYPIKLISKEGRAMGYIWTLEEQENGRWMTNAVFPIAVQGQGL